jgi:hypothetical protein
MSNQPSEALQDSPAGQTPSATGTESIAELQSRWDNFEPPIRDEEILPKGMTLTPGTQGTFQTGNRDTAWSVNMKGERTARYTINGPNGSAYGGVREQRNFNGLPEALAWHVNGKGEGFQWARKVARARESDEPAHDYDEVTRARALTKHNPSNVDAIQVGKEDGFTAQVVPVNYQEVLASLFVHPSELPLTIEGGGFKGRHEKDGVLYTYREGGGGTKGDWSMGDSRGGWNHYKTDKPANETDEISNETDQIANEKTKKIAAPSLFAHYQPPNGAKCAFGLETKDGETRSNGWFLPAE